MRASPFRHAPIANARRFNRPARQARSSSQRGLTLRSSGDLHRHGTWPARRSGLSSASRAKRHPGSGPSAQTLGLMNDESASSAELQPHDREELRLLYQVTVADLAFFKQQQWTITNYAVTAQATLVLVTYQLLKQPLQAWQLWVLLVLAVGISATCVLVVRRLGRSIEVRRQRLTNVRKQFGQAFNSAWSVPKESDDFQWLLLSVHVLSALVSAWLVLARA